MLQSQQEKLQLQQQQLDAAEAEVSCTKGRCQFLLFHAPVFEWNMSSAFPVSKLDGTCIYSKKKYIYIYILSDFLKRLLQVEQLRQQVEQLRQQVLLQQEQLAAAREVSCIDVQSSNKSYF